MPECEARLLEALEKIAPASGTAWLREALAQLASSADVHERLAWHSAAARRKLGQVELARHGPTLETTAGPLGTGHWGAGDAGRAVLLLAATRLHPHSVHDVVASLYHGGDESERVAVVRALALLPDPEGLKPLALEAGRVNSLYLFAALALRNPYPCGWYSDHEFNQLVLKSLFNMLPIEEIAGLDERGNAELARMCTDYVGERTAAGRSVPANIWLAIAPGADAAGEALLRERLDDRDREHRYFAALAVARRARERPFDAAFLEQRIAEERDPAIAALLREALH